MTAEKDRLIMSQQKTRYMVVSKERQISKLKMRGKELLTFNSTQGIVCRGYEQLNNLRHCM